MMPHENVHVPGLLVLIRPNHPVIFHLAHGVGWISRNRSSAVSFERHKIAGPIQWL